MNTENIKIKPTWNKSKEEIWKEQFAGLQEEEVLPVRRRSFALSFLRYAAAVLIVLSVGTLAAGYWYTKEVVVLRGENRVVSLPDGSRVTLNAETTLKYKPLWWHITRREVLLTGEGYFEVTPGGAFTVLSGENRVWVLGTSFNIFARDSRYLVSCLTGKVQVSVPGDSFILTPGMGVGKSGDDYRMLSETEARQSVQWTTGHFYFLATPLREVVEEIERQYDIRVVTDSSLDYLYSGNFSRDKRVEEILEIVGEPFGVKFSIK